MEVPLLYEIVIIFLLSIFVTIVCNKIKLPATVGFLLTGVLCGPSLLGIVKDMQAIDHIAELGVAMLLFTIGMELSGEALNRLKRPVFLGGSLQIGLTVLAVAGIAMLLRDAPYQKGLFWGCLWRFRPRPLCCAFCRSAGPPTRRQAAFPSPFLFFRTLW